jgi:hypothetical protein
MIRLYACEPVHPFASIAVTVKLNVPAVVGVPVIPPVDEFKDRPGGSAPETTLSVYGGAPPEAVTVVVYSMPIIPFGDEARKSVIVGQALMVYACEPWHPFASVAVTVKLNVPAVVGVPVIPPVDEFRNRPAGNDPNVTAYV